MNKQLEELSKACDIAEKVGVEMLQKSHISGYTRQDGTVVAEHEDSRQAAAKASGEAEAASKKAKESNSKEDHIAAAEAHWRAYKAHPNQTKQRKLHHDTGHWHASRAQTSEEYLANRTIRSKAIDATEKANKTKSREDHAAAAAANRKAVETVLQADPYHAYWNKKVKFHDQRS